MTNCPKCEELRKLLNKKQEYIEQLIAPDVSAFEEMPQEIKNESLYSLWKKLHIATTALVVIKSMPSNLISITPQGHAETVLHLLERMKESEK